MAAIDYTRFDTRRLGDLLEQSSRTEIDFQDRLETWQKKVAEASDANLAPSPDPVAKRLGFLLVDTRKQRRAIERELAARLQQDSDRYGGGESDRGNRLFEVRAVAHDDAFSATQPPLSNVFT